MWSRLMLWAHYLVGVPSNCFVCPGLITLQGNPLGSHVHAHVPSRCQTNNVCKKQKGGLRFPRLMPWSDAIAGFGLVARPVLLWSSAWMKVAVDRHRRPAPPYRLGQRGVAGNQRLASSCALQEVGSQVWWVHFLSQKSLTLVSVRLRLPRSLKVHSTFHVSKIKPIKESALMPASAPPPPPRIIGGGTLYTVKTLLAVCNRGHGKQFLVDWEGYGLEERSWIPSRFIVDKNLIRDFYAHHPEAPGPSGVGP